MHQSRIDTIPNRTPRSKTLLAITALAALLVAIAPAWAQTKTHDDHEMTDRFYIRLGGFQQTDLRTTLRLDAKTPQGGLAIGSRQTDLEPFPGRPLLRSVHGIGKQLPSATEMLCRFTSAPQP